jgi:peptidoglycan/LPS O-acetylase OafA/YrhL
MAEIFWETRPYSARRTIPETQAIPKAHIRSDVQGLRAVAVLAVLLSHIWPGVLPGGFVGVDVFFVISGYLITGSLFEELQRTGHIALLRFYIRRIKRLLPAATLVLLVVAVLSLCVLPPSRWEETAIEILASAFYVENWRLAWLAVDYMSADNAASPVQHFWSLSVEEQFYVFWPLMLIAVGAASRRFADLRTAVAISLLAIIAISFTASVVLTETQREAAYFVTYGRIWQLGLGGLLAITVLPDLSRRVREAMRTIGLAAIVLAAVAFSAETVFPGYAALLPTLGCAFVLAAGTDSDTWSLSRVLSARPAQYLGDLSYSVYLWHWPMVVFAGHYVAGGMTLPLGLTLIAATLAIAHVSKRFVEDPIRYANIDTKKALACIIGFSVCCIGGSVVIYNEFALRIINVYAESPNYPGARAFLAGADVPHVEAPIPPPVFLKQDKAEVYKDNCHLSHNDTTLNPCRFGSGTGMKVVLMGDSHAAQWVPALISEVDRLGWRLETHTKSSCPVFRETIKKQRDAHVYCKKWAENLLQYLRDFPPDLVILAQAKSYRLTQATGRESPMQVAAALAAVWQELLDLGIKVVAIRDTPKLPFDPGECIARDPDCYAKQSEIMGEDPTLLAHGMVPEVPVIDMTDAVCKDGKCPMVVGNVVVWRDMHHLTASYSRTTATALAARIAEAASGLPAHLPR